MSGIAAGRLRHWVQIEQFIEAVDSAGDRVRYWATYAERWAAIEPLSGRELIAAQQAQSEVSVRIVIRHTPGVTAAMRVVYRGQPYNIQAVMTDKDSGIDYQTLLCSLGTNDG